MTRIYQTKKTGKHIYALTICWHIYFHGLSVI